MTELEFSPAGQTGRTIIALGADLKSTICVLSGGTAKVLGPFSDLKDAGNYRQFMQAVENILVDCGGAPPLLTCDLHPMYLSSQLARRLASGGLAGGRAAGLVEVQHHHAHVAACLAENGQTGPAIGLACDGAGYGADGTSWGCEVLLCGSGEFRRLGHLRTTGLPGGDAAAMETYRPAVSVLYDAFDKDCLKLPCVAKLADRRNVAMIVEMLDSGTNCPCSSSLGRWFDALAGLCGLAKVNEFEGQAPIALEKAAAADAEDRYDFEISAGEPFQIDLRPAVRQIVADLDNQTVPGAVSAKFHNTTVAFLLDSALRAVKQTGVKTVAISGGCFLNKYLSGRLIPSLQKAGLKVLTHKRLPPGDACVSLGQAVVAACQENTAER